MEAGAARMKESSLQSWNRQLVGQVFCFCFLVFFSGKGGERNLMVVGTLVIGTNDWIQAQRRDKRGGESRADTFPCDRGGTCFGSFHKMNCN